MASLLRAQACFLSPAVGCADLPQYPFLTFLMLVFCLHESSVYHVCLCLWHQMGCRPLELGLQVVVSFLVADWVFITFWKVLLAHTIPKVM